jgi:alkanesulfonate monooxygenase SsuD/methylene tetrahydromethanopterin reductase-like flavin-dependent oxidoreductase (luciferase family)
MEFGIFVTSQPNPASEPYPHREVHGRVTAEILESERLGYDTAWVAEHHFSNRYGIMPDVFSYLSYLAARTARIRLGAAVVTLPLYDPVRVAENAAFVDILSGGRLVLGLGSGYRPYEFAGLGREFERRHEIQEEAAELVLELLHTRRARHEGTFFRSTIDGDYELFPANVQEPHPPLFMAAGSEGSTGFAARHGLGLMLSTLPSFASLARQIDLYRSRLGEAQAPLDRNPAFGDVGIARWVYVAESDAEAKRDSEEGILRHLRAFAGPGTAGYLGNVSEKGGGDDLDYDELVETTLLHGSPETVAARLRALEEQTGLASLLLHYPPYYGHEKAMRSIRLFAEHVLPRFRAAPRGEAVA